MNMRMTAVAAPVLALLVLLAGPAYARRIDIEAGAGALISLDKIPVKDNLFYGISAAVALLPRLDFEAGISRAEGRDTEDGTFRTVNFYNYGLRFYPWSAADSVVRFYLSAGGARVSSLTKGTTRNSIYVGPGLRMQAGEHSGLLLRAPILLSVEGNTNTVLIPTLSWYYQFF